jgi:hypothetical protein
MTSISLFKKHMARFIHRKYEIKQNDTLSLTFRCEPWDIIKKL